MFFSGQLSSFVKRAKETDFGISDAPFGNTKLLFIHADANVVFIIHYGWYALKYHMMLLLSDIIMIIEMACKPSFEMFNVLYF